MERLGGNGGSVTAERRREVLDLLRQTEAWAHGRSDVLAVGLVGSWARGEPRMDSDVDVVVVTTDPDRYLNHSDWIAELGADAVTRTERWGPMLTERRLRRPSGLEVEFGVATRGWALVDPVDAGTAAVVRDGFRIVTDPGGILAELRQACRNSEQ